ncbi:hypothetical protein DM02DRAFT_638067 [Periconia macrospinosa]|uniref:Phospholipid metabolism enzyme regulator n=1 Tax=Periconia macrospinosa TaxID=97972 RepID=A0A2V1EDL5_9PLEO|nr:hypothetical protein DM02DRAFT_638067 [Periconia macrospinosa]
MRHQPALNGARSLNVSGSPSTTNSPLSSRDTSPARTSPSSSAVLSKSGRLSRQSSTDASPNRGPNLAGPSTTVPSAAAIQRALSSTNIPSLSPAASQESTRAPRPQKIASGSNSGDTTPHWPISPRLKSPPPTEARSRSRRNSLRSQQKKPDVAPTPSIVVQSSSPAPSSRIPVKDESTTSEPDDQTSSMKAATRGTSSGNAPKLETVQESSVPTTPGVDELDDESLSSTPTAPKFNDEHRNDVASSKITEDLSTKSAKLVDNSIDAGSKPTKGKLQEMRSASAQRAPPLSNKPSISSLSTIRSRTEPPLRNMTVETETVPSVAQPTIGNQDRSASGRVDGSLRLKPSNETIRPKKERKPAKRKAPSINCTSPGISYHPHLHPTRPERIPRSSTATSLGSPIPRSYDEASSVWTTSPSSPEVSRRPSAFSPTSPSVHYFYPMTNAMVRKASSKADVFEQKVATAVDEADSSDSDHTFIYESNPPDQQPHRSRTHHHSRTPSMTSIASLVDPRLAIRDAHKNPNKKSSMKFANPYNNANGDVDGDRGDGTIRIGSGRISGGSHHHHIGRYGQGRGGLSHINVDSDSSMPQSSRARGPSSRHPSQPNSPRFQTQSFGNGSSNGNGLKKHGEYSSYDIDMENVADDERTPLIPTRSPRARTPRSRHNNTLRQREHRHRRSGGWCRQFAGCLVLCILLFVVVFSAVGLVFATTKPLSGVSVREIQNVIASPEELILDLVVEAVNPNIIGVTIGDMDCIIFAKSKHVGSDKWWREHGNGGTNGGQEHWVPIKADEEKVVARGGVDHGTDPIPDPEGGEPQTMSLGRIFHFDTPLNFDGTFFKQHAENSTGQIRLSKPGNRTETGGTERWEEVLQYPFQLIVRGTFKYQLPLSTRERKESIIATYSYDPDAEKKKLKALEGKSKQTESMFSTFVSSTPLGRFDRRAPPLLDRSAQ